MFCQPEGWGTAGDSHICASCSSVLCSLHHIPVHNCTPALRALRPCTLRHGARSQHHGAVQLCPLTPLHLVLHTQHPHTLHCCSPLLCTMHICTAWLCTVHCTHALCTPPLLPVPPHPALCTVRYAPCAPQHCTMHLCTPTVQLCSMHHAACSSAACTSELCTLRSAPLNPAPLQLSLCTPLCTLDCAPVLSALSTVHPCTTTCAACNVQHAAVQLCTVPMQL